MKTSIINKLLTAISIYFVTFFSIIKFNFNSTILGAIWELTFIPLLIVGTVLSCILIGRLFKNFQKSFQSYFGLVLSISFIIYFGYVVYSLTVS